MRTASGACFVPGVESPHEQLAAVQEIFLRAFEPSARAAFNAATPYRAYLRAITCNYLINRATRVREHVWVEALEPDSHLVEATAHRTAGLFHAQRAPAPDQQLNALQLAATIRAFLSGADERERRLTELRFLEGLSQRDAADAMGLSRAVLRRIEDRIRPVLTSWLRAHGFEHAEVFE